MRNLPIVATLGSCLFALSAGAQNGTAPFPATLEKELAARASNYTEVSMDKKMLTFAGKFSEQGRRRHGGKADHRKT